MMAVTYRHIIYIYFPYLAAARIYRQGGASGQPMVFVQSVNGADQVMACCAAARRQGLGAGMRLASLQTVTSSTSDTGADGQNGNHNHAQQDSSGKNSSGNQSFANKMGDASQDKDAQHVALDDVPGGTAQPQGHETAVISILA